MNKLLVIDLDEFQKQMAEVNLETTARAVCVNVLLKSKLDVIEFEAEVHVSNESNHIPRLVVSSGGELDHLLTEEKLQVFVIKLKKPEEKW